MCESLYTWPDHGYNGLPFGKVCSEEQSLKLGTKHGTKKQLILVGWLVWGHTSDARRLLLALYNQELFLLVLWEPYGMPRLNLGRPYARQTVLIIVLSLILNFFGFNFGSHHMIRSYYSCFSACSWKCPRGNKQCWQPAWRTSAKFFEIAPELHHIIKESKLRD